MDLGAIGYLPAASAIADTLAENSLKLISLKGLLETYLQERALLLEIIINLFFLTKSLLL
jgi:hypothetical protein